GPGRGDRERTDGTGRGGVADQREPTVRIRFYGPQPVCPAAGDSGREPGWENRDRERPPGRRARDRGRQPVPAVRELTSAMSNGPLLPMQAVGRQLSAISYQQSGIGGQRTCGAVADS